MVQLKTTSDVMDILGGNTIVAEITGRSAQAVSNWRKFSTFPSNTFVILKAALAVKGYIAPDSLWGMTEVSAKKVSA